jgi:hypothetical protein
MTGRRVMILLAFCWLWILAVLMLSGCGSPTSSSEVGTPNEELAKALAQCHGEHQALGPIEVVFHEKDRGDNAKGWAWPGGRTINLVRPWVNSTDAQQLELTVAHEVCHCKGLFSGAQADFCAQLAYRDARCH